MVAHMDKEQPRLAFGTTVYAEDGTEIGQVRGIDENGLYITLRDGIEGMSVEHVRSGQAFGEAELLWRCWECGELVDSTRTSPTRVLPAVPIGRSCTIGPKIKGRPNRFSDPSPFDDTEISPLIDARVVFRLRPQ